MLRDDWKLEAVGHGLAGSSRNVPGPTRSSGFRTASLVQFPQFPDGIGVALFRGHEQQDASLIAIHRYPVTMYVKISEHHRRLSVSCLNGGPELLRRNYYLLGALRAIRASLH